MDVAPLVSGPVIWTVWIDSRNCEVKKEAEQNGRGDEKKGEGERKKGRRMAERSLRRRVQEEEEEEDCREGRGGER